MEARKHTHPFWNLLNEDVMLLYGRACLFSCDLRCEASLIQMTEHKVSIPCCGRKVLCLSKRTVNELRPGNNFATETNLEKFSSTYQNIWIDYIHVWKFIEWQEAVWIGVTVLQQNPTFYSTSFKSLLCLIQNLAFTTGGLWFCRPLGMNF